MSTNMTLSKIVVEYASIISTIEMVNIFLKMLNCIQINLFQDKTEEIYQIKTVLTSKKRYTERCCIIKQYVNRIALFIENNTAGRISDIIVLDLINQFKSKINKHTKHILDMLISNLSMYYRLDALMNEYTIIEYSIKSDRKKIYDVICNILTYFIERYEFIIDLNLNFDDNTILSEDMSINEKLSDNVYTVKIKGKSVNFNLANNVIIDDLNSIDSYSIDLGNTYEQNIQDDVDNIDVVSVSEKLIQLDYDDNIKNNVTDKYICDKNLDSVFKDDYKLRNDVKDCKIDIDNILIHEMTVVNDMLDYHNEMSLLYITKKMNLMKIMDGNKFSL